jgi:cytochrome P450 family 9
MDCVLLKTTTGEQLQKIYVYNEHSVKMHAGIFSFDQPSLLIRDLELVKNILAKDSQSFTVRVVMFNEKVEPLLPRVLCVMKGKRWRQVRAHVTPVFTSDTMKMMFYLVEVCGEEISDYLNVASAEGKRI